MTTKHTSVEPNFIVPGNSKDDEDKSAKVVEEEKKDVEVSDDIKISEGEGREYDCALSMEIKSPEGGYKVGETYPVSVFKGKDVTGLSSFSSNGTFVSTGEKGTSEVTDNITFTNDKIANLSHTIHSELKYEQLGKAHSLSGKEIEPPRFLKGDNNTLYTGSPVFASIKATYLTSFLIYHFTPSEVGSAIIAVTANSVACGELSSTLTVEVVGDESSSCCCSSSDDDDSNDSNKITVTDVTLIYKDFVNGQQIEGATVFLNGVKKGITDSSGSITLYDVKVNTVHKIKATKDGYLNTDSDSLSNDSFMVEYKSDE